MPSKTEVETTEYHEDPQAVEHYTREEIRRLRQLLRRLRFLEKQVQERGGLASDDPSRSAAYVELEIEGFELVLTEIGFLRIERIRR